MEELEICHVRLACDHVPWDRFATQTPSTFGDLGNIWRYSGMKGLGISPYIADVWAALLVS